MRISTPIALIAAGTLLLSGSVATAVPADRETPTAEAGSLNEHLEGLDGFDGDLGDLVGETEPTVDGVALSPGGVATLDDTNGLFAGSVSVDGEAFIGFDVPAVDEVEVTGDYLAAVAKSGDEIFAHVTDAGEIQLIAVFHEGGDESRFEIDSSVPEGYRWEADSSGGLQLISVSEQGAANAEPLAGISAPWAVDADGTRLPTTFEVDGDRIVQVVDTSRATFPVVADPSAWWWATHVAGCLGELALLAAGGAKVISAFAKAEKIVKAAKTLYSAYKTLGGKWDAVVEKFVKYVKNKKDLTKKQAKAVETMIKNGSTVIVNLLGLGTCKDLIMELM